MNQPSPDRSASPRSSIFAGLRRIGGSAILAAVVVLGSVGAALAVAPDPTVTFVGAYPGVTGCASPQSATAGTSALLTANSCSWGTRTFAGWNTSQLGARNKVATILDGASYTFNSSVTLYAVFTGNQTIQFDGGDGVCTDADVVAGANRKLAPHACARVGYDFVNWRSTTNPSNYFSDQQTFNVFVNGDDTFVAQWSLITDFYTVTYLDWDGTNLGSDSYSILGTITHPTDPSRSGYGFDGWYDGAAEVINGEAADDHVVTAFYIANQNDVLFDANDGGDVTTTGIPLDLSNQDFDSTITLPADPERVGYTFDGWDGNGDTYFATDTFTMPDNDVTLTAQWVINTWDVTFDANDGGDISTTGIPSTFENRDFDSTITLPADPERVGYTFNGWDGNGDTYFETDTFTMPDNDVALTAQWILNDWDVLFDANDGGDVTTTGIPLDLSNQDFDSTITLPADPERVGYTFDGWDGNGDTYFATDTFTMPDNDVTLTAQWVINTWDVTFDANDGGDISTTGIPSTFENRDFDSTITLPADPERVGYTFNGWDGNGDTYFETDTFTMPDNDVALTAQWTEAHDVTFVEQGGAAVTDIVKKRVGEAVTIPTPSWSSHEFVGWYDAATGGTLVTSGFTMPTNDVTLYAYWAFNASGTVIFFPNGSGATCATASQTETTDSVAIDNAGCSWTDRTFEGWAESPTATSPDYETGDQYDFVTEGSQTSGYSSLYAVWSGTVTFDKNGGDGSCAIPQTEIGNGANLAANTCVWANHTFKYWTINSNGTGTRYTDTAPYNFIQSGSRTLYANWDVDLGGTVGFDKNGSGATCTTPSQAEFADGIALADAGCTWANRTFEGWAESSTATSTDYETGDLYNFVSKGAATNGLSILYAVWSGTVTFDKNGGDGSCAIPQTEIGNGANLAANTCVWANHTFKYWTINSNGTGTRYTDTAPYNFIQSGSRTLYANWDADTGYTLTFIANGSGASCTSPSQVGYANGTLIASAGCTWTDRTFAGWATTSTATVALYQTNDPYNFITNGSATLYAVWSGTVTFDKNGGDGNCASSQTRSGNGVALTANSCSWANHTFKYWTEGSADSGTKYADAAPYNFAQSGSRTLYAQWADNVAGPILRPGAKVVISFPKTLMVARNISIQSGKWQAIGRITYAYRWLRCSATHNVAPGSPPGDCTFITGATAKVYRTAVADRNFYLIGEITATDTRGSTTLYTKSTSIVR